MSQITGPLVRSTWKLSLFHCVRNIHTYIFPFSYSVKPTTCTTDCDCPTNYRCKCVAFSETQNRRFMTEESWAGDNRGHVTSDMQGNLSAKVPKGAYREKELYEGQGSLRASNHRLLKNPKAAKAGTPQCSPVTCETNQASFCVAVWELMPVGV